MLNIGFDATTSSDTLNLPCELRQLLTPFRSNASQA